MCIAVYKPVGQKLPSKKIFSNCFSNNSDGAGFMFPLNGKVHYEKGFMSFTAFKNGLKKSMKKYGITPMTTPMVFHFRITSQGGVKPSLTHPFPLTNSFDKMRQLKGDYDVCCVHNGIIDFASSYKAVDYSDTMEFVQSVAYPLINKKPLYYKDQATMGVLKYLLNGNRFCFMDARGHVELIGDWKEDNGIYYSNSSYSYRHTSFQSTNSIFRSYSNPFYDDYEYSGYSGYPYITKDMEKELLEKDVIHCECGEEMVIEYFYDLDECYAYCPTCGETFELTNNAKQHALAKGLAILDDEGYDDYSDSKSWNESFGLKGAY